MAELVLKAEPTPNPRAYKFSANRVLNPGPAKTFYDGQAAEGNPVAKRLFAIPGVNGVMILNDFCTVNQDGSADWDAVIPQVEAVLRDAFS